MYEEKKENLQEQLESLEEQIQKANQVLQRSRTQKLRLEGAISMLDQLEQVDEEKNSD